MKHEQRGKLAKQATRAPRANIAEEQLALKLARLMSMIQSATKANPNKQTKPPKKHPTDQLIREVKRK